MLYVMVSLLSMGVLGRLSPVEAAASTEEQAVKKAISLLQDSFNGRDFLSLSGEVDFEYMYIPVGTARPPHSYTLSSLLHPTPAPAAPDTGVVVAPGKVQEALTLQEALDQLAPAIRDTLVLNEPNVQRIVLVGMGFDIDGAVVSPSVAAGAGAASATGLAPAEEQPDPLKVDLAALKGHNLSPTTLRIEQELALFRPKYYGTRREEVSTATAEYSLAERRLLRWDVKYLFKQMPSYVLLHLVPLSIVVEGDGAVAQVEYSFGAQGDSPAARVFTERTVAPMTLKLAKTAAGWRIQEMAVFVSRMREIAQL